MEWLPQVLLTVSVALVVMWFVKQWVTRPKNLPPGPRGLPFLGVAWTMMTTKPDPLKLYSSWADKYGDIVSFKVGPMRFVVLNSYQVIVDAFQHPDLNNRPYSQMLKEVLGIVNHGVVLSNGKVWKEHRNFVHSVFRSLGVGKKTYEDTIAAEMAQLTAAIEELGDTSFSPVILFEQAIANIICTVVFGTQYKYSDQEFQKLLSMVNENLRLASGGGALMFLPIPGISKLPFGAPKKMVQNIIESNKFFMKHIKSHEKDLDEANPRDFIDLYLKKMAETKDTDESFDDSNLQAILFDLFAAGSETTTSTVLWCILHMMAYPEIQSRVQAELDHVVGRNRLPGLDDRETLPYTNAVLLEVQRRAAVAALGVPHIAARDTLLHGYTIPKGATIMPNIWRVLYSKDHWEDPDAFKPERFLTEEQKLIKREELIIFSTGRRVCLGEQLARMESFLCFTTLLHRFTFKKPDNSPPLSFEGVLGLTRTPVPFETCAIKREC